MVFIVFLAFFEMEVIHALKLLAWKSRNFFNQLNYQSRYLLKPLFIKISINQNFYLLSFNLTFKTNPFQL